MHVGWGGIHRPGTTTIGVVILFRFGGMVVHDPLFQMLINR